MIKRLLFIPLLFIATTVFAGTLLPYPLFKAIDGNGNPIRGGKLYTYEAGTSTAKDTYSDRALTTPHDNPVVLDSEGQREIYLNGEYKMNLKDRNDRQMPGWPVDNIFGMGGSFNYVSLDETYSCDLAAAVTAIGATETTLMVDCEFTVASGTTVTIPSTMTLQYVRGGSGKGVSGGGTETLTYATGSNIIASPNQKIHGDNLTVTIALGVVDTVYPGWRGFSTAASGANNQTYLTNTISDIAAGQVIEIPPGSYTVAGNWTISKACTVQGAGELDFSTDAINQGLLVTVSDVEIKDITLTGPQYVASVAAQNAIYAYGADKDNYITGLTFSNLNISTWGAFGIRFDYVEDFIIERNRISNIYYAAVEVISANDGVITGNIIDTVVGNPIAYGIVATRQNDDSLVTEPRSSDIVISNNRINNIPTWEALDTHGGANLTFANNVITGCFHGISVGAASDGSGDVKWAPQNITIIGNTAVSGVTDGSYGYGVALTGAWQTAGITEEYGQGNRIIGNTVEGYGDESNSNHGAIYITAQNGLVISGNTIIDGSPQAIHLLHDAINVNISDNIIVDAWSDSGSGFGLNVTTLSTGKIADNTFIKHDSAKTSVMVRGINIEDFATNFLMIDKNFFYGVTQNIADDGHHAWRALSASSTATSGVGEDDLKSLVIHEDTFGANQTIRFTASFRNAGANDTKTGKFHFGASSWTVYPAANNTHTWFVDVVISIISSTAQKIHITTVGGTTTASTISYQTYDTAAIDLTAADTTVKFTGECANANDTITQYTMDVSYD